MKFISLHKIANSVRSSILRFPLLVFLLVLAVAAICTCQEIGYSYEQGCFYNTCLKVCIFSCLAFFACLSAFLFAESKGWKTLYAQAVVLAFVGVYYYLSPFMQEFDHHQLRMLTTLFIAAIISISFAAFSDKNNLNAFWQFNKMMILRLLTTFLYCFTLWGGISLAIIAIESLFAINIDNIIYFELFFTIFGIIGGIFFLAGIPKCIKALETETSYPKALKIFTQYILLPLVALYILILYAYSVKTLIMWQLPQGQVSYLVLALAAVGILSSLFVWPLRGEKNNQWVQAYLSYFYWIFLPLLAFLYVAIGRRIIDYGITPDRYYVMLATFWLSFIVIYFMLSKKKNIKLIPATFSLLCILTCFGPWGVFSVSERSQINRLQTILEENKILVDKKIAEPLPIIDDSTTIVINQMISFIYTDCSDGILEKLAHKWNIEQDSAAYVYSHAEFSSALGLKNTYTSLRAQERFFWRDTNKSPWRRGLIAVSGYHYFVEEQTMHFRDQANHKFRNSDDTVKVAVGQDIYKIAITEEAQNLQILLNDSILLERSIVHELDSLMKNGIIHDSSLENDETISFIESSEKIEFKFLISSFNADIANDTSSLYPFRLTSFGFYMLIKNSDYSESEEF